MFTGSAVALVTPFTKDEEVDYEALNRLVDFHLENKTQALVILGTTGESPTVTEEESLTIWQRVVEKVAGRVPVIAGSGKNDTRATVKLAKQAAELGVDALLIVTPYYNKPTQEGLYRHYSMIADSVALPQILYNVPGRTGVDLLPETVARLASHPNIVALKETTTLERVQALQNSVPELPIYCGDDENNLPMLKAGASGLISVTANVVPRLLQTMCEAFFNGELPRSEAIHAELGPLNKNLFVEANPIPVKYCLAQMKRIENVLRLPLTPLSEKFYGELNFAMQAGGVLI